MRRNPLLPLAAALTLAAAWPAVAQVPPRPLPIPPPPIAANSLETNAIWARQEALDEIARQQSVARQNQLMSFEAQIRTEQNLRSTPGLQLPASIPLPDVRGAGPYPQIDTGDLASIPDSVLADSNRKVLEAAANRR